MNQSLFSLHSRRGTRKVKMTGFSKYFNQVIQGHTCEDMIHPWTHSCHRAFWDYMRNYSLDGVKFFAPAVFVSVIWCDLSCR